MHTIKAIVIHRESYSSLTKAAVVTAKCDPEMVSNPGELFGSISHAVTRWVKATDREATFEEDGGFDLDDLNNYVGDVQLLEELKTEGIHSLKIDIHTAPWTAWDYTDNLIDDYD